MLILQSLSKLLIGILLIITGIVALTYGYNLQNAANSLIGWLALLIGAFFIAFAIAQYRRAQRNPKVSHYSELEKKLLVQAMIGVARADGAIRNSEVITICNIHDQLLGIELKDADVRQMAESIEFNDSLKELADHSATLKPEMKKMILQSCNLIIISDSEIAKREENSLYHIGKALGFSKTDVDHTIAAVAA